MFPPLSSGRLSHSHSHSIRVLSSRCYRFFTTTTTTVDDTTVDDTTTTKKNNNNINPPDKVLLSNLDTTTGVLTLTLNRPRQHHALNLALLEALHRELSSAANNRGDIRAVVIESSGPVFSSGHDLKELIVTPTTTTTTRKIFQTCRQVMQLLSNNNSEEAIPQPTIASVQGLATAAGFQLAAACDLVLATPGAQFATPGVSSIGLFCHTPAVELVRCTVGPKVALDMLYTGRILSAEEALRHGLVSRIIAGGESELRDATHELARAIASRSAPAMQLGKRTVYKQQQIQQQQQQQQPNSRHDAYEIATQAMLDNLEMEDAKAGIDAFLNKQPSPEWKHK
jgi:enoyl-CoA hydratase/carnithine racemase